MKSKARNRRRRLSKPVGSLLTLVLLGLVYFAQEQGLPATAERSERREGTSRTEPPAERRTAAPGPDDAACIIERVSDGDTVSCEDGRRIRRLLIDTPERKQEPYGERAKGELEKLLPAGTEARVELDVRPRDQYGRTLAYLYTPDGKMVNREMVRRGYAVVLTYPPNVRYVDDMRSAQSSAQKAKRGLWATPAFDCPPRDYRAGRCR